MISSPASMVRGLFEEPSKLFEELRAAVEELRLGLKAVQETQGEGNKRLAALETALTTLQRADTGLGGGGAEDEKSPSAGTVTCIFPPPAMPSYPATPPQMEPTTPRKAPTGLGVATAAEEKSPSGEPVAYKVPPFSWPLPGPMPLFALALPQNAPTGRGGAAAREGKSPSAATAPFKDPPPLMRSLMSLPSTPVFGEGENSLPVKPLPVKPPPLAALLTGARPAAVSIVPAKPPPPPLPSSARCVSEGKPPLPIKPRPAELCKPPPPRGDR